MKKIVCFLRIVLVLQIVFIVFSECLGKKIYTRSHDVFKYTSNDNNYRLSFFCPYFRTHISPVDVHISLYKTDGDELCCTFYALLDTNHKYPNENNFKVEWRDEYVKITVIDYKERKNTVRLYFGHDDN